MELGTSGKNRSLLDTTPQNKLQVDKKPKCQKATLKLLQEIQIIFSPLWHENIQIFKYHIRSGEKGQIQHHSNQKAIFIQQNKTVEFKPLS